MLRGLLWDSDGVLVDSERIFFEVNRDYFRLHQIDLSEQNFFDWFLASDCGAWHLLKNQGMTPAEIDACRRSRNDRYTKRLMSEESLLNLGVANVLARLDSRIAMGVVTSASREHFDAIHQNLGLMRYFEFVLTAESYIRSKPSPEPYLLGLKQLGLPGRQCLAIEDSPRGLQAANAAGINCIVLRNAMTRHHPFTGAYRVVDSADQLLVEIESLL
ncbi:MAG: HAD family phosphatase [Betaproteobacteria bacterium]|nr:HAD family phosphatase [Betaproteobacteria bacterium]